MNAEIQDMDIVVGIDQRGVAHVLKHRTEDTKDVKAEVTLTTTHVRIQKFSTQEQDTLGLLDVPSGFQSRSVTAAEGAARLASARVAVDPAGIKSLLLEATTAWDQLVLISGTKVDGTRYEQRGVRPISISNDVYLYCEDVQSGATRTFTLANIDRAEFA